METGGGLRVGYTGTAEVMNASNGVASVALSGMYNDTKSADAVRKSFRNPVSGFVTHRGAVSG
jgi:hypothetical protein